MLYKFLYVSVARVATVFSRHATAVLVNSVSVCAATEKQPNLVLCCSFDLKSFDWFCNGSCYSARRCVTQNLILQITHQTSPSGSYAPRASYRERPRSVPSAEVEVCVLRGGEERPATGEGCPVQRTTVRERSDPTSANTQPT